MFKRRKESGIYFLRSPNHEIYPKRVQKTTLFPFDDKKSFVNNIDRIPPKYHQKMIVKVKEKIEKTKQVKNSDETSKIYLTRRKNCKIL